MNGFTLIAGILAGFTVIGHFTMGNKSYLKPMLNADFDIIAKKVMHSVFHYISVFLTASSLVLLNEGLGLKIIEIPTLLLHFIAVNYAGFALVQIAIALTSKVQNGVFKMFQWTLFSLDRCFYMAGDSGVTHSAYAEQTRQRRFEWQET